MKKRKNPLSKTGSNFPLGERSREAIPSDVLGSYTGMSRDGDRPVQDADDL